MIEEWEKVDGFPDYSISNFGRVRRDAGGRGAKPGRILKPSRDANGYACVNLWRHGSNVKHYIHRLVAFAFIGKPPSGNHHIGHWDGDGMNAQARNLRWVTQSENEADKVRHGRANYAKPRTVPNETAAKAFERLQSGESMNSIASDMGFVWGTLKRATDDYALRKGYTK